MNTFIVYYYEVNECTGMVYKSIEIQAVSITKCYTLAKHVFGASVVGIVLKSFDSEFIKGGL